MTYHIAIKPLSVNQAWQGRRFKTPAYKAYEQELSYKLPAGLKVPDGKLELSICVGFSSAASDADNMVKPFQDGLQKKYGFNDSRIYRLIVEKIIVKKGAEFVQFRISPYNRSTDMRSINL